MESNLTTPAIVIFATAGCTDVWSDVLLGIEEEGIPFVIQESPSTDVIHNAWLAACQSPLLVGIGCNREKLVVHYKNLPTSAPLFTLTYQQDNHARRSIGNNAARLVKGIPFRECHS
ncbi:glycerol dehydratase reactivase beta/small subunit family protein [Citrobacter sp. RHBSTW-00678]|uniref:Propanediol dehydratase n=1 Tax=Citrobacter braakii TaxID=57706 RepID=A0AAD1L0T2_CITBR|nr:MULTISPECIES: glycerol dehydratase reactivase beta/small subunit family protein [Citrobacter]AUV26878.1 propanediol dehydratase [Citrobacter freundii complex sp. CFNIH3]MBA7759154.1 glycerol dehydratase reactivase beta/small subunit family protein [Citrobacter sp. RHBSTW-00325]MBA8129354.1 glycerol dehydratase reactivase beta/small subunit family protein [Citrobacter sp. RHBSTW-00013]MBJ8821670.1 glycerol dehydratase reactivase beta/small subunit family protein [Citrobacter braakii]MBP58514